ncbi:hypothetical protein D9611_006751 [Ephemerocybe angulata]|uniref:CHAT domain-containing protein n=1 Tax=Ephemerocybe angulata TaxID=980116 RepID=A0A8H5C8Z1_9AGAR|nr:hypothetical protein D9611_006751 [Tulosesus angulatus]
MKQHSKNLSVLDNVASSYTPIVAALAERSSESRWRFADRKNNDGVQWIYEMGAREKVRVKMFEDDAITTKKFMDKLEHYSCVHLACHASQNTDDPLQSQFLFHTGSLYLASIVQKNLKNADLAFLSARQRSTGGE